MDTEKMLEQIKTAKGEVDEAEADLTKLLGAMQVNPRAEKATISETVAAAFTKLRAARHALVTLEKLATAKD
jgi:hypothetical protein